MTPERYSYALEVAANEADVSETASLLREALADLRALERMRAVALAVVEAHEAREAAARRYDGASQTLGLLLDALL